MRLFIAGALVGFCALVQSPLHAATVHQIIHNGETHQKFSSETCQNGSRAVKWKDVYWCPLSSYKVKPVDTKAKTVAKPTPKPVPAPAPAKPGDQIVHAGQTWQKYGDSSCENGSRAIKWKDVYWCPLSSYKVKPLDTKAHVHAGTGGGAKPTPTPVPPPIKPQPVPTPTPTPEPVQPVPTYDTQLSWSVPQKRENGAALALSEIRGYEIYYTSDDLKKSGVTKVTGSKSTTTVVSGLQAGVWHFTISAIDSSGVKSKLSPVLTGAVGKH